MAEKVTLTLTPLQARSLLHAASRGIDEWDYEPTAATTPPQREQTAALCAWQQLHTAVWAGDR